MHIMREPILPPWALLIGALVALYFAWQFQR
jgi:hypothetical protein